MRNFLTRTLERFPLRLLIAFVALQVGWTRPKRPFLLAVRREIAERDLDQLNTYDSKIEVRKISGSFLYAISAKTIPLEFRRADFPTRTWPSEFFRAAECLSPLVSSLKYRGFRGLVSANTNYWHEQPLRIATEVAGLSTFVVLKEAVLTRLHAGQWRSPTFPAIKSSHSRIFVANHETRLALLDNGSATDEQIVVSGLPRFEAESLGDNSDNEHGILFMSFGSLLEGRFRELNQDCLQLVKNFCLETGYQMVVKLKDSQELASWMRMSVDLVGPGFKAVWKPALPDLIRSSRICIGGPSFSTVEALMMGYKVLSPCWGQLADADNRLMSDPNFSTQLIEVSERELFLPELNNALQKVTQNHSSNIGRRSSRWAEIPEKGTTRTIMNLMEEIVLLKSP